MPFSVRRLWRGSRRRVFRQRLRSWYSVRHFVSFGDQNVSFYHHKNTRPQQTTETTVNMTGEGSSTRHALFTKSALHHSHKIRNRGFFKRNKINRRKDDLQSLIIPNAVSTAKRKRNEMLLISQPISLQLIKKTNHMIT